MVFSQLSQTQPRRTGGCCSFVEEFSRAFFPPIRPRMGRVRVCVHLAAGWWMFIVLLIILLLFVYYTKTHLTIYWKTPQGRWRRYWVCLTFLFRWGRVTKTYDHRKSYVNKNSWINYLNLSTECRLASSSRPVSPFRARIVGEVCQDVLWVCVCMSSLWCIFVYSLFLLKYLLA